MCLILLNKIFNVSSILGLIDRMIHDLRIIECKTSYQSLNRAK